MLPRTHVNQSFFAILHHVLHLAPIIFDQFAVNVLHLAPTIFAAAQVRYGEVVAPRTPPKLLLLHHVPVESVARLDLAKHDVIDLHLAFLRHGNEGALVATLHPWL